MEIRVIGCGCAGAGDDAVGLLAVRALEGHLPAEVALIEAGMPGIGLIDILSDSDACVLVDCVQAGGEPGSIYRLAESELSGDTPMPVSAHGFGVAYALRLGRAVQNDHMPAEVVILGVEPAILEGVSLSPAVRSALPTLIERVCSEVQRLIDSPRPAPSGGGA